MVEHPWHYSGYDGIECMQAMRSMMGGAGIRDYWWGCAYKYLWRWTRKNQAEDLRKARQCIDYLLAEIETESGSEGEG